MGLASKLAAAQGTPGAVAGAPPPPQQSQGQSYPGQQAYQSYPGGSSSASAPPSGQQSYASQGQQYGAPPAHQYGSTTQQQYGAPPTQQYGAPPPQQQQFGGQQYGAPPTQQYGAPPPQQQQFGGQQYGGQQGGQDVNGYKVALQRAVQEKGLERIIPPNSPMIDDIARKASFKVNDICAQWRIPQEVGRDLARLGLYDIVLFIDDSGSMQFEENGERIDDMKLVLKRVAQAGCLFDEDGISIRFMNTVLPERAPGVSIGDGVKDEAQINEILRNVKFQGLTPLGRELRRKVVDGIVLKNIRQGPLRKPVLVIVVTDGQPAGDEPNNNAVVQTVTSAVNDLRQFGQGAIAFEFAQVGNDTKAREFLGRLDSDPNIGQMIDVTSNFEQEQQEMLQQNPPVELTPDLWIIKLLLGAIDPSYDSKDESRSYRPGASGNAPQGQQSYPPQSQQYGAPPSQQYAGPYGGQQQYSQQQSQYNRPPPPGPQTGYGAPQSGYNPPYPQQGGGGGYAPPQPPRY